MVSAAAQASRRRRVLDLHRKHCFDLFRSDGSIASPGKADQRILIWHAMAFLGDGAQARHVERARAMLRRVMEWGREGAVSHFWTSGVSSILARWGDQLDGDVRDGLARRIAESAPHEARQRFRGYNDNFPAMAALCALVGGPAAGLDDAATIEEGLQCLRSLRDLLTRRGFISEHTSPTYTPITLTCLAEIAELSPVPAARELARAAEERIWTDLCARFHPATSFVAGPHSRAYSADLCAHFHNAHMVLYQVLGDACFVNATNAAFPTIPGQALDGGRPDFIWKHIGWQTMPTFHVPEVAVELALAPQKALRSGGGPQSPAASDSYGFEVAGDTEQAAYPRNVWKPQRHPTSPLAEFAAGSVHTYAYLTPTYAVGTADRTFLDGFQHSPFHVIYPRQTPARDLRDVVAMFPRLIIGDREPDRHHHHLYDDGRALCLGHRDAAMVVYRARPHWGASLNWPDWNSTPAAQIRLSLMITCFHGTPAECWLGTRRATTWQDQCVDPVSIFLHDGPVFAAIHPLIGTDLGRTHAVRLRDANGFGQVEMINYDGASRTFDDATLATCLNGFIIELGEADAWSSRGGFEAFRAAHATPHIQDNHAPADGMRHVRYARGSRWPGDIPLALEMSVSPVSDGIKFRAVNGRPVPGPRFAATGFDASRLHWLAP